jgi:nucleoside phosphorylase
LRQRCIFSVAANGIDTLSQKQSTRRAIMDVGHNPKLRFGMSLAEATSSKRFQPKITGLPALPVVDFAKVGKQPPKVLPSPTGALPKADTVVITWTDSEWAALQHVFCAGGSAMPYSESTRSAWPGWQKYAANLPSSRPKGWDYWGLYQLVAINGKNVLLFKSNTHLDYPGEATLVALIKLLISDVQPRLILSAGTAGGAKPTDHIGTVRAVSAGTLYDAHDKPSNWTEYKNGWTAGNTVLNNAKFKQLLFPVPTKLSDLNKLRSQFNAYYQKDYGNLSMAQLDPKKLNIADPSPKIFNQTGGNDSLLTASTFIVATIAGNYQEFTVVEMDDTIIGEACKGTGVGFGFIRNLSDPAQNGALPTKAPGSWGSAVYDVYGFYTAYNGALATWAMLA